MPPRLKTLINPTSRLAFSNAFAKGLGLGTADRTFVEQTAKNPGRRLIASLLFGVFIAAAIFLAFYYSAGRGVADIAYKIIMGGVFIGILLGAVFIIGIASDFTALRMDRAEQVANCLSANPSASPEICSQQVVTINKNIN